jgi:pyruvate,water dikinase
MVSEGRLPDEELIFFMTPWEISNLLKTRSPRIVARASKRCRLHDKIAALNVPEIIYGPLNMDNELENSDDIPLSSTRVQGTPVSQGVVRGTARVVIDLKDAHVIQQGDILITRATDIGWSPYFPMLSGVVTEIGGLISHGAVVAREYGLPCIVSAIGATSVFKSGDQVIVNGTKGTIDKVEVESERDDSDANEESDLLVGEDMETIDSHFSSD